MPASTCMREVGFVYARRGVCRERICDQEAESSLDDEDLGVGSEEDIHVGAVGSQGLV